MNCEKCGKSFQDDAVYCPYCGKKLGNFPSKRKPKRGNGQGTAFKRGSTWTAQVTVGMRDLPPIDLKNPPPEARKPRQTIRRSKGGFRTKAEALAYCATLKATGGTVRPQIPRLEHYWTIYSSGEMDGLSASKKTAYRIAWNKLKNLRQMKVDAITIADLRKAVSETCPTYYPAKDCKNLLSHLFELAAVDGFANRDIPSFIILPKLDETERTPFSETEQAALWKLYEAGDIRAAIPLLMIYTGMMPGEAMALQVHQIDMQRRTIIGVGMKTKVRKKTPIVLAENILPVVQDLIDHAQPSGFIWKRNEDTWYNDYYSALESAGCRKLPPYSCRHTTATALAITEGIAPQTIKRVMRWSTTRMLDRYAHPDHQDALNAVDTIGVANNVANGKRSKR